MSTDLVTIEPLDTIEHAAREIYDRKIGCLPVVAEGELVGIITSSDMMRTLIELIGAHGIGSWVEVEVPNQPGMLANVTDVIRDPPGQHSRRLPGAGAASEQPPDRAPPRDH